MTPQILVVDIGNTETKMGLLTDGALLHPLKTCPTEKENLSVFQDHIREMADSLSKSDVGGVIVASVVPALNDVMELSLVRLFPEHQIVWADSMLNERLNLGKLDISNYASTRLGADRVANMVGGQVLFPDTTFLVCDFGTTTTFDLVAASGVFMGGAISPGPRKFQSLINSAHAAQLFEVDVFHRPSHIPGLTTDSCLENGLYLGYKGLILEIVRTLIASAGLSLSEVKIIFTGGYGQPAKELVADWMSEIYLDPSLTLKGLFFLWHFQQQKITFSK